MALDAHVQLVSLAVLHERLDEEMSEHALDALDVDFLHHAVQDPLLRLQKRHVHGDESELTATLHQLVRLSDQLQIIDLVVAES